MEVHLKKAILVLLVTFSSATYDFVVKPEFGEKANDLNITAYVGQTSRLPCTVKHLSGKRVSWIRQRDLQVLSTGRHTFSTDLRISVLPGTRFKLRRPRDLQNHMFLGTNDSFGYQISSQEPRSSFSTLLNSQLEDEEEERPGSFLNVTSYATETPILLNMMELGEGGDNPRHKFPRYKMKAKRGKRSLHRYNYNYTRQKTNPWYKSQMRWEDLESPIAYYSSSTGSQKRSKKALPFQRQSLMELQSTRSQEREQSEMYKKETNPIAIYPQGPISIASDSKNFKLAPNYIDGVWEPEDYTLQIKFTKPQDAGTYICQINTEPRITQAVVLRVVKMRAEILGRQELFVKAGNPIKLSCKVNYGALSPGFILWYKGERLVEYENSGGRIQVQTEVGGVSHLLLNNALPDDSSNYTCSPAGGEPASLILNVIVDERQAAMQQGNNSPSIESPMSILLCMTLLMDQLMSCPTEHLQPISHYLFPSVFLGFCCSFVSCSMKSAAFVCLFLLLLFASVDEDDDHFCEENLMSNPYVKTYLHGAWTRDNELSSSSVSQLDKKNARLSREVCWENPRQ